MFTEEDVRQVLLKAIELAGSQQAFAVATGFSKQYVSNVVRRHRRTAISDALALKLGFQREVFYSVRSKGCGIDREPGIIRD